MDIKQTTTVLLRVPMKSGGADDSAKVEIVMIQTGLNVWLFR